MVKNSFHVLSASSAALSSMLLRPARSPNRSWSSELTCRFVQRLLNNAVVKSDDWLRSTQDLLAMKGPALGKVFRKHSAWADVPCLECWPKSYKDGEMPARTIVYFHGGGYVVGSAKSYQYTIAKFAYLCDARVIAVDYRRAPEHPLPAAQADCLCVVQDVLEHASAQDSVFLAGDSAGGALVLHTLKELKKEGRAAAIDGAVLLSPWVRPFDMDILSMEHARADILNVDILQRWLGSLGKDTSAVAQAADFSEASFIGLPPMYIQAGGSELFKAQIDDLVKRLRSDNVSTAYDVFPGQFHVFQTLSPLVPEAERALVLIAKKLEQFT